MSHWFLRGLLPFYAAAAEWRASEGNVSQSSLRQRRVQKAASESWFCALLVLGACGEAPESAPPPSGPSETVTEQRPAAAGSDVDGMGGAAQAGASPETVSSRAIRQRRARFMPSPDIPAQRTEGQLAIDEPKEQRCS